MKLHRTLPLLGFALAALACGGSRDAPADSAKADTAAVVQPAPAAVTPIDTAFHADSASAVDSTAKNHAKKKKHASADMTLRTLAALNPLSVAVAGAQTASSSSSSDTGHRAYHWPWILGALIVAAAGYAWYRQRSLHRPSGGL